MHSGDSGEKTCFDAGKIRFCHCAAVLPTQVPKLCTDLDLGLLYILILGASARCLRVEFLLKTDSGYPKDKGVNKPWQPLEIPFVITH